MTRRSRSGHSRRAATATLTGCALALIGGCGGADPGPGTQALSGGADPGEGGTLVWAVADPVREVDPLGASNRAELLAARQVHEPLVEKLSGPFGETRRVPGLARRSRSSNGGRTWSFQLRSGIRFQDGARFNAGAALVNAERWRTTTAGRRLIGDVIAVDAPRPDLVRFFLATPDPDFGDRLADPHLGIVSPRALRPHSGTGATLARSAGSGTGAFELRERDAGGALLARNTAWWATALGLGPALDQVRLEYVALPGERARLLARGEAEVASSLGPSDARSLAADPLLVALPSGGGRALGVERSVRGVESGRELPSLAGAWLTTITNPN